jgi:hypothetical protein
MSFEGSKSAAAVGALLVLILGCNTAARKRNTATTAGRPDLVVAPSWANVAVGQYHAQQTRSEEEEAQAIGYKKSQGTVLEVRRASVTPFYASAGKPLSLEMEYALLCPEQELDVSEELEILKDGKRLGGTVPQTESRRPGRWRVRASISVPRGAKPGAYVMRSSVRAGNLADSREVQFRVAAATETSSGEEPKAASRVDRDLMQIQGRLKDLGHDPGPIDGRMHPQTQAALKAFQSDYGLPPTGEVDPETRAALGLSRGTSP